MTTDSTARVETSYGDIRVENGFPSLPSTASPIEVAEAEHRSLLSSETTIEGMRRMVLDTVRQLHAETDRRKLEAANAEEKARQRVELEEKRAEKIREQALKAAEDQQRTLDDYLRRRREDSAAFTDALAAVETRAFESASAAMSARADVYKLLRTPQEAPKGGAEVAGDLCKYFLDKVEGIVKHDPRVLGGVARLLEGVAADLPQTKPADSSPSAESVESTATSETVEDIANWPMIKLVEAAKQIPSEVLNGRQIQDLPFGELLTLVTGYATKRA